MNRSEMAEYRGVFTFFGHFRSPTWRVYCPGGKILMLNKQSPHRKMRFTEPGAEAPVFLIPYLVC